MDIRDDPSTTTTTTDYDSGDSAGVQYVYEGQSRAEKKETKGRCPGGKRSPRARARAAKCTCGAAPADGDAETTVFEEDTDIEDERGLQRHPTRPRQPSGSGGVSGCHGCHGKRDDKADRKKSIEKKVRGVWVPYIEEYPDGPPRAAIFLKEHKIPRRSSASDAKHVRDLGGGSLSSGSRGRSPTGKRLPPRQPRRPSKDSSKRSEQQSRHLDPYEMHRDKFSDHDNRSLQSDSDDPYPAVNRSRYNAGPDLTSTVARSSAWNESPQPKYSSSWPLNAGLRIPQRRAARPQHEYDCEAESEGHEDFPEDDTTFDERHLRNHTRPPALHERDRDRERDARYRVSSPTQRGHERPSPRQQPRRQIIASSASMATVDQGRRSVAPSTVCEVWRGHAEDWESPYVSAADDDFDDSEIEEPIRLLSMDGLPPRTSSPHLLPPRGERRGDFGFQSLTRSPPRYHQHHPSVYMRGFSPGLFATSGISRNHTWGDDGADGAPLLLDGPRALTTEPDAMTDEEGDNTRPLSRASHWSKRHRDGPPPVPPAATRGAARGRPFTHPLALPRSRAVSPVFSTRETTEGFLSPKPTRAVRFDFGAWGCDHASRGSLALGLL